MSASKFLKTLSPKTIDFINESIDKLFAGIKVRLLGGSLLGKRIYVTSSRKNLDYYHSIPGIYEQAARLEGAAADVKSLHQILKVAESFVDASKERTKAKAVAQIQHFLSDNKGSGGDTDIKIAVQGVLTDVFNTTQHEIRTIVDSETNHAKNVGTLEGIIKINTTLGIEDPIVFFATVPDQVRCDECTRVHLLPDKITPRVYRLSEVGSGYHKKGDNNPKMSGLHPHCRCSLTTLMPGFGFKDGRVSYIAEGHDEYATQRA